MIISDALKCKLSFISCLLFLKGFSKLLICGGKYELGMTDNCEAIDLDTSLTTCRDPPSFPKVVYIAIGGLTPKESPIICGGYQRDQNDDFDDISSNCYSSKNKE